MNEQNSSGSRQGGLLGFAARFLLGHLTFSGVIIVGVILLIAALWWAHDADVRNTMRLEQVQQQANAKASSIEAQVDQAVKKATVERAAAIRELELGRGKLERVASDLQRRLNEIQGREHARSQEIAALPLSELAIHVTQQLGAERSEVVLGTQGSQEQSPNSGTRAPNPNLVVSEAGFRKIASALSELESCQEQASVKDQLISNCQQQASLNASVISQMNQSVSDLKEAVRMKDEVLAQKETAHAAELKAARGTWRSRLVRAAEYVAVGVAVGVAIR